jgi:lipoyl(octanoyl) transferase
MNRMESARRSVAWAFLGRVPYRQAEALQHRLREALLRGETGESLLLLEHPHVYTLGRNAGRQDLLVGEEWLAARGVEVAECDRGGQVTYHGPGQLVGYPILDLDPDRRDIRRYVADLMGALVAMLGDLGVTARPAEPGEPIGVWTGSGKIASLGIHIRRWVTTHGFALNLSPDLSFFEGIVPCGLPAARIVSVESLTGRRPSLAEAAELAAKRIGEVFDREMVPLVDPERWSAAG